MNRWPTVAMLSIALSTSLLAATGDITLQPDALTPSIRCGMCHREIYSIWRRSMHSAAVSDPIFEASYMQAYVETAGEAASICLRCHAPIAMLTGVLELKEPLTREGVTCDFCHSVEAVNLEQRDQPFRIVLDGAKRGPLDDAESSPHGIVKSTLHKSAEFCAGCHEYTNDSGIPIVSTYTEWKESPQAAAGKTCQHCHIPHNVAGMHSSEQVRSAATARVLGVERGERNRAVIRVEVANVGSGHSIPTGMPTRKLRLRVVLFAGGREVRTFERLYQRVLLDQEGRPITEDHRTLLDARTLSLDSRLRPGERRIEEFVAAAVPQGEELHAEITLHYLYEPNVLTRERLSIEISADRSPGTR